MRLLNTIGTQLILNRIDPCDEPLRTINHFSIIANHHTEPQKTIARNIIDQPSP